MQLKLFRFIVIFIYNKYEIKYTNVIIQTIYKTNLSVQLIKNYLNEKYKYLYDKLYILCNNMNMIFLFNVLYYK